MPGSDVIIKAEWAKVNVSKSMDGEIYTVPPSIMKSHSSNQEIWKYSSSITKIVFENEIHDIENVSRSFDISEAKNETVMAHMVLNDDNKTYTVYIQGNEKVIANHDSSYLFYSFSKLTSIEGLEYFDTSQVTSMSNMFYGCSGLTSLDLSNFDTSQVTTMNSIFHGCRSLTTTITISNPNITSYGSMFSSAATNDSTLIKVNYTTETSELVDQMIATKSSNSSVVKGELVS